MDWPQQYEPWESSNIGLTDAATGAPIGGIPLPAVWKKVSAKEAKETEDAYNDKVAKDVDLNLPQSSPLSRYAFESAVLESDEPPTLAFSQMMGMVGNLRKNQNRVRYVKLDGLWQNDMASFGQDSGTSFADMFGGADIFNSMLAASAPIGMLATTQEEKDAEMTFIQEESAAIEEVYLKLKAEYQSRGLTV
jgi:hypothetical protein